jgi:glucuronate isomerase
MKTFISDNFLLRSDFAATLYHDYAKNLPIIDYHSHLPQEQISKNHTFTSLTEIWLKGDHYKWRAMRAFGVQEKFITGNTSDEDKFNQWAHVVPHTMRNPLYHWTHLELLRYFDIDDLLTPDTAAAIYSTANEKLDTTHFATRSLLKRMNVEVVCTTDDPTDSLEDHRSMIGQPVGTAVFPTFRPDRSFAVEDVEAYNTYLNKLAGVTHIDIKSFDALLEALQQRINYFHDCGTRLSDHGLEHFYFPSRQDSFAIDKLFQNLKQKISLSPEETGFFKYRVLLELGRMYHAKGWTQQFHVGALRNTNQRLLKRIGPDSGFDSIGDFSQGTTMARFFNALDLTDQLAKTILYNLNPSDNELFATMAGNFNDGSMKGKIQFGSAWWFLDQKDGMEKQLNTLSNLGLLSCFIGMLTDSRSFMSFPRHEYFRRILCNLIGEDVKHGELPADEKWLGKLVENICYHNAKNYFNFEY